MNSSDTSEGLDLKRMKPEILWRHMSELAELKPERVIGRYDQTLQTKNEVLASGVFLYGLKRQFKATGMTDATVDRAVKGFLKDIGR